MEVRLWWRTRAGAVRRQLSRCAARHGDGHRSGFAGAYGDGLTHGKGPDPSNRLSTHELVANVGADKDSDTRQRQAIAGYAKRAGFELVGEFYDAAVSGKDPIEAGQASKHSSSGWWATACASSSSRMPADLPVC